MTTPGIASGHVSNPGASVYLQETTLEGKKRPGGIAFDEREGKKAKTLQASSDGVDIDLQILEHMAASAKNGLVPPSLVNRCQEMQRKMAQSAERARMICSQTFGFPQMNENLKFLFQRGEEFSLPSIFKAPLIRFCGILKHMVEDLDLQDQPITLPTCRFSAFQLLLNYLYNLSFGFMWLINN